MKFIARVKDVFAPYENISQFFSFDNETLEEFKERIKSDDRVKSIQHYDVTESHDNGDTIEIPEG